MALSFAGASSSAAGSTFSFATPAASSSAFSFASASTPATPFGQPQSTGSLFGAASTPAAGAGSSSLFGAASTPSLFGGAASTPSLFGASSTPSLFGGSSAGAFGASSGTTTTPSLFGGTQTAQPGALSTFSGSAFGAAQPQGAFGSTLSGAAFGAQPQQQPQQQQVSGALSTKEGRPLTHATKWDDISPQGQAYLLELEKIVAQYREESRQLDDNPRLWGDEGRTLKQDMADDERALRQALAGLEAALKGDLQTLATFREKAVGLLHDTELVVRTFQRAHRWRTAGQVLPGQALPPGIREQLNGPIVLPSMYLRRATKAFQETMEQYRALVAELEALLPAQLSRKQQQYQNEDGDGAGAAAALAALPVVLNNLHDFFNHVAARLEKLHDGVAAARDAFLERRRQGGDLRDPFAEADRREHLKRKAAAARVAVIPPGPTPQQAAPTQPAASAAAPSLLASTGGGLFGGGTTSPSLFGATPAPSTATPSLFGGGGAAAGGGGLFGASTPAWGAPATSTPGSTVSTRRGRTRK